MRRLCAIRGAITAENTKESIEKQTVRLVQEIISENNIRENYIVDFNFSLTRDLDVLNPATALRLNADKFNFDVSKVPLFCSQEAFIQGSLERCIRVLVTGYFDRKKIKFVYLDDAKKLRPDIS
nr:chorismate mutase [uncultured Treponema sp.]